MILSSFLAAAYFFGCGELFAAKVEAGDQIELPDQRKIVVRDVEESNFREYTGDPSIWPSSTKVHFEFHFAGKKNEVYKASMMQGYNPSIENHRNRLKNTKEGIAYVQKRLKENPERRFYPTEFFSDLKFKEETVHLVFSPRPMLTLRQFLKQLDFAEGPNIEWGGRLLLAYELMVQIKPTLEYLWKDMRVHFDLKPENIIISPEGKFYLIDFESISKVGDEKVLGILSTRKYAAPEALRFGETREQVEWAKGYKYSPSYDLYAFGKILKDIISSNVDSTIDWRQEVARVHKNPNISYFEKASAVELRQFIDKLMNRKPRQRSSASNSNVHRLPKPWALKSFVQERDFNLQAWAHSLGLQLCYSRAAGGSEDTTK